MVTARFWTRGSRRKARARSTAELAIASGHLRELHPALSVYNRLAALEWDSMRSEVEGCGGVTMARIVALNQVGGFDPSMIAGEEPELCIRLRQQGWKTVQLDAEMAVMTRR